MGRFSEKFDPSGFLEIWKVYDNGKAELHYSDNNIVTSGMGVGLAYLFAGSGSNNILDYQITRFQVGTSAGVQDASTFKLASALEEITDYGGSADIQTISQNQIENGVIPNSSNPFAIIPFHHIHKVGSTSVKFNLVLNKNSGNGISAPLQEVGLFMNNPTGVDPAAAILVAYRTFTSIQKTTEFSLIFKWTISF